MIIPEIILDIIQKDHRGRENAIRREDLLRHIQHKSRDYTLTDRRMREIVKSIPQICSCEKGYYLAGNKSDSDYAIEYLKKKIFPLWDDIKQIQEAYPEYYKGEQLELFSG